jgi:hypothetical protein
MDKVTRKKIVSLLQMQRTSIKLAGNNTFLQLTCRVADVQ